MIPELVTVHTSLLTDLGDAVRERWGLSGEMTIEEMTDVIKPGVPSGYTEIEWLGSNGTQRIESGIINDTLSVPLRLVAELSYSNTNTRQLNGSQGAYYFGVVSGYFQVGQGGTDKTNIPAANDIKYKIDAHFSGVPNVSGNKTATVYRNSEIVGTYSSEYGEFFDVSGTYNTCLFSLNGQNLPSTCRIYSFDIYKNNNLVRSFKPCIRQSDSVAGMYDIINGQFYTNAGSGTFITP